MERFLDPDRIDVAAGAPFVVALSGNGVGGYLWEVAELGSLRLVEERDVAPSAAVPGAGGSKEVVLLAEAGEATARFALRRSWEAEALRTVDVLVVAR